MKSKISFFLFFFLLTSQIFGIDIKVRLLKGQSSVFIQSDSQINITRKNNSHIIYLKSGKIVRLTPKSGKIQVGLSGPFSSPLKFKSASPIKVNQKKYRGQILIYNLNNKLIVINKINIEEYIYGVVPREISVNWSDDVIKAQTVVARTFALIQKFKTKSKLYDLDNSTYSQMYEGYNVENERVNHLIDETTGEVVIYKNKLAQTFYHSTCGGTTEDPLYVWGHSVPYLKTVHCPYCTESPNYSWTLNLSLKSIENKLRKKGYNIRVRSLQIIRKDPSGRISKLKILGINKDLNLTGNQFRNIIGPKTLKSTRFQIAFHGDTLKFLGHGWGHGIGMCQWGAKTMSDKHINYKRILRFYYRGIRIVKFTYNLVEKKL